MLHSLRTDTCKLAPAQCEYRQGYWRYWYQADHVYGYATVYFMCAIIGVFTIGNIILTISRRSKSRASGNLTWRRGLATGRFLSYRSFYIQGLRWYSPSAGVMLLGVCGAIYFFGELLNITFLYTSSTDCSALTLGPKPYYWPNTKKLSYGGSPPLATRSGWMAVALLPFVM
jgi:ferric-chelate reductase